MVTGYSPLQEFTTVAVCWLKPSRVLLAAVCILVAEKIRDKKSTQKTGWATQLCKPDSRIEWHAAPFVFDHARCATRAATCSTFREGKTEKSSGWLEEPACQQPVYDLCHAIEVQIDEQFWSIFAPHRFSECDLTILSLHARRIQVFYMCVAQRVC